MTNIKTDYEEKLKDPRWQKKRLLIFQRDNWTCQLCHSTTKTLAVHHKAYLPDKEPWDYPNRFLVTLCEDCHSEHPDFQPIAPTLTNFEKVKIIIGRMAEMKFDCTEYRVLLYLINQQFNFIKDGKVKDGDYVGYGFLARQTERSRKSVINAVKSLVNRHILIKESGNKFGNHYHINEHCYEWRKAI